MATTSSKLYFPHVVATPSGDAFLVGHPVGQGSEPTFTRFAKAGESGWAHLGDLGAVVCAATSMHTPGSPRPSVLALGRDGPLRIFTPGRPPADVAIAPKDRSYFEGICAASEGVYVCGGQRQIAHWASGNWNWVDEGLFVKFDGTNDCTLLAIADLADGVLLTVGSGGFAALRLRGGAWQVLDTGTNVDLHCLAIAGDGGAWVGGDGGTLLRLHADRQTWSDVSDHTVSTRSFDSLALLDGTLYIAAFDRLLALAPQQRLVQASGPVRAGAEFHSVSAAGSYLWATGDEHVHRFGPDGWRYFLCPDNV